MIAVTTAATVATTDADDRRQAVADGFRGVAARASVHRTVGSQVASVFAYSSKSRQGWARSALQFAGTSAG